MTENDKINRRIPLRILALAFIVMAMLALIVMRLWQLQVLSSGEFNEKAVRQYARSIRIPALRGRIYAADGQLLAGNRTSFEALFHLSEMNLTGSRKKSVARLLGEVRRAEAAANRISGITAKDLENHLKYSPGIPMVVFKALDAAALARLAELAPPIQGLELAAGPVRVYPRGPLAAHVLGFTGPADPSTDEDRGDYFYYLSDVSGRSGLERACDRLLRGKPGGKLVIVNHRGFVHKVVGTPRPAQAASDLIITLDSRLQAAAEQLLAGKAGAIVLMDASDGSVAALASAPGYDPNEFIPRISAKRYHALANLPGHPFVNKALQSACMPGSIIKPLMALAILEGGIPADATVNCTGAVEIGDAQIHCWAQSYGGHGMINLSNALKFSCNSYFIQNGLRLGVDRIGRVLQSAGIGRKTGIGLPEAPGLLPERRRWKHWNAYDTGLIAIGQGRILVTPIQAASYAAALANGGWLWRPRLVREIRDPATGKRVVVRPHLRGRLAASAQSLELVRRSMFRVVNESGGTGRGAQVKGLKVHGKTGTAEVGSRDKRRRNAWFIGFAAMPSGRRFAVAVLVLDGISGNQSAAPLAAALLDQAARLYPQGTE